MTYKEAIAAVFGAEISYQTFIAIMRNVAESERGAEPAREVLTDIIANLEEGKREALHRFYHHALNTKIEETTV